MFVITATKSGQQPQYLAHNKGRRPYRWVGGDDGLHAALRYSNEEEAGIVAIGRVYYGVAARVIWDPLSKADQPRRRRRGYVVQAGEFYVVMKNGSYRWLRDQNAAAEAFRFSSESAAGQVVAAGFRGTAGKSSRIVRV